MSTAVQSAFGTILQRGDGSGSEVFTAIAELRKITGPGHSQSTIDVSNHQSTNNYAEFVSGQRSGGEISIEGNYIGHGNVNQAGLLADLASGVVRNFKLLRTTGTAETVSFAALVTAFAFDQSYGAANSFTATLKISGQPTTA